MFKLVHYGKESFRVIAPDGTTVISGGYYPAPAFFKWKGEDYMAITQYFVGENECGVYKISQQSTEEIDETDEQIQK